MAASNTIGENKPTGVVFGRSEINFRMITDGTSKTYMVGEKYMSTDNYYDGLDWGDNEPAFSGNNNDTLRITAPTPWRIIWWTTAVASRSTWTVRRWRPR